MEENTPWNTAKGIINAYILRGVFFKISNIETLLVSSMMISFVKISNKIQYYYCYSLANYS